MRISKAKLKQLIKEELASVLEADTAYYDRAEAKRKRRRDKERQPIKQFFGQEDPLATQTSQSPPAPHGDLETTAKRTLAPDTEELTQTSKYTESERLFRHFFGKYDDDALEIIMHSDPDSEDIITQLYGWQLPGYKSRYDSPGTDVIHMARQFEKEDKQIDGNEEEFLDRLQKYQYSVGKSEFDQIKQSHRLDDARKYAASELSKIQNIPHPDTIRPNLISAYIEYVAKKFPEDFKRLTHKYAELWK
tara:strand:+ start:6318 stop:7061 length:744 start_codon:yes stop_codon:yes gene_type:complete